MTHDLVADRCATGGAVRCGRVRQMLCIVSAFLQSDQGVCKLVIKASFSSGLSFIGTQMYSLFLSGKCSKMLQVLPPLFQTFISALYNNLVS